MPDVVVAAQPDGEFSGIRPFEEKDIRAVRMLVGQGIMEGLTELNKQTYFNPKVLTVVLAVAAVLDYYLGWKPFPGVWWSYIAPVIGVGILAVPGMGLTELMNRGYFDTLLRLTLGSTDLASPQTYYSTPSSGFYVLEHKSSIIAIIGLDASSLAGTNLESVIPGDDGAEPLVSIARRGLANIVGLGGKDGGKKIADGKKVGRLDNKAKKALEAEKKSKLAAPPSGSGLAQIRHLYVDNYYRRAHLATDLIDHAISKAGPAVKEVVVIRPSYVSSAGTKMLSKVGFKPTKRAEGWQELEQRKTAGGLVVFKGEWMKLDLATRKEGKTQ